MEQTIKNNNDILLLASQGSGQGSGQDSGPKSTESKDTVPTSKNAHMNNEQIKLYYNDVKKLIGNMDKSFENLLNMDIEELKKLNNELMDKLKVIVDEKEKENDRFIYYFVGQTTFELIDAKVLKDEIIEDLIQKQKEEHERCKNFTHIYKYN